MDQDQILRILNFNSEGGLEHCAVALPDLRRAGVLCLCSGIFSKELEVFQFIKLSMSLKSKFSVDVFKLVVSSCSLD